LSPARVLFMKRSDAALNFNDKAAISGNQPSV
jgi:hypothetical protein